MKTTRGRNPSASSRDAGLSLVEVLVAVLVVVTVALGGAGLSINGIQTATAQQRQQVAVTIANGAMETVSGWSVANLVTGRYYLLVTGAFSNYAAQPGVNMTYPMWDAAAPVGGNGSIPITVAPPIPSATENGTEYTTATLIGTCYEPVTGGTCALLPGYPSTPPAVTPAGYVSLIRIIILVSWTAGAKCTASTCYYETTTLADPHSDLAWVTS